MITAPKQIAELLGRSEAIQAAHHFAVEMAFELAAQLAKAPTVKRSDIAATLQAYASKVVPGFDHLTSLEGLERRTLVLWGSRVLVEACYMTLPRGPILFTIESHLGGIARRTIAHLVGERVSAWLDGFIELEVAKLRKAQAK